jgi:mono/diheme cytochrome c family protein
MIRLAIPSPARARAPAGRRQALPRGLLLGLAPLRAAAVSPKPPGTIDPPPATRGQLLYETHCIACHTTQMHWRDGRIVSDWAGLLVQVRRWQATAKLNWRDEDIEAVARHLNDTVYKLPVPERRAQR